MGENSYKSLIFVLVLILLFSLNVSAEWRHPDCPEDFEGYKKEYEIPRHEFEILFKECYMPKEVYEFRKARDEKYKNMIHYANESEEYRKKTEESKKRIAEWKKNPPPKPKPIIKSLPPSPSLHPLFNPKEAGKKRSQEELKTFLIQNKHKIWWLNKSWEEQSVVGDESSIYYKIQNFKNEISKKIKSKIWRFLFEE